MKTELALRFGCLYSSIEDQLKEQNLEFIKEEDIEKYEGIRRSINVLFLFDYINEKAKIRACKKLISDIAKRVKTIDEESMEDKE